MVSEVLVHGHLALLVLGFCMAQHQGREHVVEPGDSPHGRQEAERPESKRSRVDFSFATFAPSKLPLYWVATPTFRASLSPSVVVPYVNHLWKRPHRCTRSVHLPIQSNWLKVKRHLEAHACNPSIWRPRQQDHEFKAHLSYIVKPCLKTKTKQIIITTN
jgi:hypothetical protein